MPLESVPDCPGDAALAARDNLQQAMKHVAQAGSCLAAALSEATTDTMSQLEAQADAWVESAGSTMKSLAGNLGSDQSPPGVVGTVSNAVADTMEKGGEYLQTAKVSGAKEDFTKWIRRHPIASMAIAVGLGWVVGRSTRK